ncbi:hypothetical protein PENTCL1PPCAC_10033, partial [Pristionchus entomophagus]
ATGLRLRRVLLKRTCRFLTLDQISNHGGRGDDLTRRGGKGRGLLLVLHVPIPICFLLWFSLHFGEQADFLVNDGGRGDDMTRSGAKVRGFLFVIHVPIPICFLLSLHLGEHAD